MENRSPLRGTPITPVLGDLFQAGLLAILLDPVALLVLLVLLLHGAPGNAVGAVLLAVLILCGVEGLLVDLLGSLGQVVLDAVWQLSDLLVGHRVLLGGSPISRRSSPSSPSRRLRRLPGALVASLQAEFHRFVTVAW